MFPSIVIVDVQGFKIGVNKFVFKEIVILYTEDFFCHYFVESPFKYNTLSPALKRQADYLTKHYHGIKWNTGGISIAEVKQNLKKHLCCDNTSIYVKGKEKIYWLRDIIDNKNDRIFDLDEIISSSLTTLKQQYTLIDACGFHDGVCALQNAQILNKYLGEIIWKKNE